MQNHRYQIICLPAAWLMVVLLLTPLQAFAADADRQGTNPRADFWRSVREGTAGYTAVPSKAQEVLIQTQGQLWREIRNGPLAGISPWVLAGVLAAIGIFFVIFGQDKLKEPRSGVRLHRFSLAERVLHWYTAILFILSALSGLSILFGRAVLIPIFGLQGFAAYMEIGKFFHNFSGPFLLAGIAIEIVVWIKDNIPKKMDVRWFRNLGGMIGGPRPHSEKINGGEKAWFWLMVLAGTAVGITGVILDFPIWGQSRQTMQISQVIHAAVAVLFVAASFGHIYVGTIGVEGTFKAMWRGWVDAVWAKEHADLWYKKKMAERAGQA